jgi:hypothetical protein
MEQFRREPLTEEQQKEKIVRSFFRDGRLASIPVKEAKRMAILEYVAQTYFENDHVYTETEVNSILRGIYEDHCTLRRDLVDAGYLARMSNGSEYRRS